MPQPFDIICAQDPPHNVPWLSHGPYNLWYDAGREVTEEDKFRAKSYKLKHVVFYVHNSIHISHCKIHTYKDHNTNLVATLRLLTPAGYIDLHNVYNRLQSVDIDQLVETCTGKGGDILLGDFNLHHESWCGNDTEYVVEPEATKLFLAIEAAKMRLLSTRGAITYSRSIQSDQHCSTIDLVFGSRAIASRDPQWKVLDVPGFESDHRVTQTVLDITPERATSTRLDWKRAKKKKVLAAVERALKPLDQSTELRTTSDVDKYASDLVNLLHAATTATVPRTKPRTSPPDLRRIPEVKAAFDKARSVWKMSTSDLVSGRGYDPTSHRRLLVKAEKLLKQFKRRFWRKSLAMQSKDTRGTFRVARLGMRICLPAKFPHLKRFVVDGVSHETSSGMSQVYRDHLWPSAYDWEATPLTQPRADSQREQYPCPQELKDGEVGQLINKLKLGKAAGIDEVANNLLKWTKDIIVPYLECLFRACIALSHVPDPFKKARTIILRKPDKDDYTKPNAWRPIALLSSIGKLLEAIVAHRLRDLNAEFNILPAKQYGVAGKCTTKALRNMLDPVYHAWCLNLAATLLSLDIKGAFDRVDREKLLEILAEKKIPDWIIKFVWSFLSNRSTTLDMPGHPTQGPNFVNIGIPQGSTLSPILFLFFAAPMLDRLSKDTIRNANKVALAFVDDTYLLAVSESHEDNCRILEGLHKVIMNWACESGVTFEPSKYAVMHFQNPWRRSQQRCSSLPKIPGLTEKSLKTELRVLGVIVDSRLTWQGHVEHVSAMTNRHGKMLAKSARSKRRCERRCVVFNVSPNRPGAPRS